MSAPRDVEVVMAVKGGLVGVGGEAEESKGGQEMVIPRKRRNAGGESDFHAFIEDGPSACCVFAKPPFLDSSEK